MPKKVEQPARVPVPGGKLIEEFVGRAATGTASMSVARMIAPPGWTEPYQTPSFDEATVVLRGRLRVDHEGGSMDLTSGEAVFIGSGERIRYGNPFDDECEYFAICTPAFDEQTVNREA